MFGKEMTTPLRRACASISVAARDEYGCATVGCMANLSKDEFFELMDDNGGNRKWRRSVEHLLGAGFNLPAKVPESAALVAVCPSTKKTSSSAAPICDQNAAQGGRMPANATASRNEGSNHVN